MPYSLIYKDNTDFVPNNDEMGFEIEFDTREDAILHAFRYVLSHLRNGYMVCLFESEQFMDRFDGISTLSTKEQATYLESLNLDTKFEILTWYFQFMKGEDGASTAFEVNDLGVAMPC